MNIVETIKRLKTILEDPAVTWALGVVGGIIMAFTPDHVDLVIEGILLILGVKAYGVLKKK